MPPTFEACVNAVEASSADVATVCDVKPYSTVHLYGGTNYRAACVDAMKFAPKVVEAQRRNMPPALIKGFRSKFEESRGQCLNPPAAEAPVPERKMIQLWD